MRHKEGRPAIGHGHLRRRLTRLSICKVIARAEAVDGKWTAPKLQKAACNDQTNHTGQGHRYANSDRATNEGKTTMKTTRHLLLSGMFVAAVMAAAPAASAQQTTGTPGSPSATTTIDGKYVPPPPAPFGGVINMNVKDSKPYWPPNVVPPKGAPNVLLIMTDDQGYGVTGTFGGVIPTPAMDRIAKAGLRYTQFHSTALCSPTRAALITGRNHHSVGFGVITEQSTGYPGYDSVIERTVPRSARS